MYRLCSVLLLSWSLAAHAFDFNPTNPSVEVGESIQLSVTDSVSRQTIWTATNGSINGTGSQVVYTAPRQAGIDAILVLDSNGNADFLLIEIKPASTANVNVDLDKAVWRVFTDRSDVIAQAYSPTRRYLLVGTIGGLEQRDLDSGKVLRVFTSYDGLPHNHVKAMLTQGVWTWIGTKAGGVAIIDNDGKISGVRSDTELEFDMPREINAFATDGKGGLWVGSTEGLLHRSFLGQWQMYTQDNADLPSNAITALASVETNNDETILWVGTDAGLARLNSEARGEIFTIDNSDLPYNQITSLHADDMGGLWVGFGFPDFGDSQPETVEEDSEIGLPDEDNTSEPTIPTQLPAEGDITDLPDSNTGVLLTPDNPPEDSIVTNVPDNNLDNTSSTDDNTLPPPTETSSTSTVRKDLIDPTDNPGGVLYIDAQNRWMVYDGKTMGLSEAQIYQFIADDNGGLWVASASGLAYFRSNQWETFTQLDTSSLPSDNIFSLLLTADGALSVGTNAGLANLQADDLLSDEGIFENLTQGDSKLSTVLAERWQTMPSSEVNLPSNFISALLVDNTGSLLIGTQDAGVGVYNLDEWEYQNNLPNSEIKALANDNDSNIWVATSEGLLVINSDKNFKLFKPEDIAFLLEAKPTGLAANRDGSMWLATEKAGVGRYHPDTGWENWHSDNSDLPSDDVFAIASDDNGGVWLGVDKGLLHFDYTNNQWQLLTETDGLPESKVTSLLANKDGSGVWVGTETEGLAYYASDGTWTYHNNLNSNSIRTLLANRDGQLWVGTQDGLLYRDSDGEWTVFNSQNSGLSDNVVTDLEPDGEGGLWIGTQNGLSHINFGNKERLAELTEDEDLQTSLVDGKRAAIIIHPNGMGTGYNQEVAVSFMAGYAYYSLYARGYDTDEIYFLSHSPDLDFNEDGQADEVVDAPVTLTEYRDGTEARDLSIADVEAAFTWATEQGTLDQPLLVILVDHGIPGGLLLDPLGETVLTAEKLGTLLDDYQNTTGNSSVVIMEACHSGTFLSQDPSIATTNRVVITSTDENYSYYSDLGQTSFIKLFFDYLRQGETFSYAKEQAAATITTFQSPLNGQQPQLNDGANGVLANNLCLNGCFGALPGILTLTADVSATAIDSSTESVEISVKTYTSTSVVRTVWASIVTPEGASQRDAQGYALEPTPTVYMREEEDGSWSARYSEFSTQGDYVFSFKAQDEDGFITEADPVTVSLREGDRVQHAVFDSATNLLSIPAVTVPSDTAGEEVTYSVDLSLVNSDPITFSIASELQVVEDPGNVSYANFNTTTKVLHIPFLDMPNEEGGVDTYAADLLLDFATMQLSLQTLSLQE